MKKANKSLLEENPKLAMEWHPTKNGNLKASDVTVHSRKKVWWRCQSGHEWKESVYRRNVGSGCPNDSGECKFCEEKKIFAKDC